jgi:hypothetical protein
MNKKTKLHNKLHEAERVTSYRLGFMSGEIAVPDDFGQMDKDEIAHLFKAATISTRGYRFNREEANKR